MKAKKKVCMKKMLAYAMVMVLAPLPFVACGSDDSPAASEQSSAREVSMSFKGCYENLSKKVSLLKESSEDLPLAYLYNENGQYRLMIPKMDDYCGFDKVMMNVERSGDTLRIDVTAMIPTACKCVSDHWFDIEARDADIKYFAHAPYNKKETVYEVVPGPAPEGL